jgi:hypothetical protein
MLSNTILKWSHHTQIDFYEQAGYIRGPQTNYTVASRSSNGLSAILKSSLDLEQ